MRAWLVAVLALLTALLAGGAGWAALVSTSNGNDVHVTLHAGTHTTGPLQGRMYLRCAALDGRGAASDTSEHCTLTVHRRDRVTLTVVNDDAPGGNHDLRLLGAPYTTFPAGFRLDLDAPTQSRTFVAWAAGDYEIVCVTGNHEALGLHGTLRVLE